MDLFTSYAVICDIIIILSLCQLIKSVSVSLSVALNQSVCTKFDLYNLPFGNFKLSTLISYFELNSIALMCIYVYY